MRGRINQHPAPIKIETVFFEGGGLDLEATAGFDGVHA
jgi:hypothetical protein